MIGALTRTGVKTGMPKDVASFLTGPGWTLRWRPFPRSGWVTAATTSQSSMPAFTSVSSS